MSTISSSSSSTLTRFCSSASFLGLVACLFVAVISAAPDAEASIVITPGIRYQSIKSKDANGVVSESDSQVMAGDGRVGIAFDTAGIYIGGLYRYESTVSGDDKMKGTAYGASAGIISRQFALIGTYIMNAERKYTTSSELDLREGTGFQVDAMYVAGITATFGIGPQLTYRDVKFKKAQVGSAAEVDTKYQETSIDPGIVLWWRF